MARHNAVRAMLISLALALFPDGFRVRLSGIPSREASSAGNYTGEVFCKTGNDWDSVYHAFFFPPVPWVSSSATQLVKTKIHSCIIVMREREREITTSL